MTLNPPEQDNEHHEHNGHDETGASASVRVYPLTRDNRVDHRFTDGLLGDVADVLTDHGYPAIEADSGDYEELGWMLWRFIFGRPIR